MLLIIPFLGWNTIQDLRRRRISVPSLILFAALWLLLLLTKEGKSYLYDGRMQPGMVLLGVCFGLMLLLLSFATAGAIGSGDAFAAMVLGLYLGLQRLLLLFMAGFLLSGITGFGLMLSGRAGRQSRLPLMPFLLTGYLILLAVGLV